MPCNTVHFHCHDWLTPSLLFLFSLPYVKWVILCGETLFNAAVSAIFKTSLLVYLIDINSHGIVFQKTVRVRRVVFSSGVSASQTSLLILFGVKRNMQIRDLYLIFNTDWNFSICLHSLHFRDGASNHTTTACQSRQPISSLDPVRWKCESVPLFEGRLGNQYSYPSWHFY